MAGSDAPPHRHQIREVLPAASVEVCDTRVRLRLCSPAKKPPIAAAGSAPSGGSKDYSSTSRQLVPVKRKDLFKVYLRMRTIEVIVNMGLYTSLQGTVYLRMRTTEVILNMGLYTSLQGISVHAHN